MKHEFILHFNREVYEEIYDLKNQGNYIKNSTVKRSFYSLLIASAFVILGIFNAFINHKGMISLIFPSLFFIGSLSFFLYRANVLRIWKKGVKEYLDHQEKFQSHKIVLSENTFSLIQDREEVIERWSNFRKVIVHKNYIELIGEENYHIPEKAFKNNDYSTFKASITQSLAK